MSSSSSEEVRLVTGNTLVSMKYHQAMRFVKLPSTAADRTEEYEFTLKFKGWFFGVHPPTNVLAVFEEPISAEMYVTSEWFLNSGNMTLKSSTHLQEHQDSYYDNAHGTKASPC